MVLDIRSGKLGNQVGIAFQKVQSRFDYILVTLRHRLVG
jgi:hypothetical protein